MVRRSAAIFVIAWLLTVPLISASVAADGMTHEYIASSDEWYLSAESSQYGMISYIEGTQRMVMGIVVNSYTIQAADSLVWIFPIPSNANDIEIGIMPAVTEFSGDTMSDIASSSVSEKLLLGFGTQLYPILLVPLMGSTDTTSYRYLLDGDDRGVDVVTHVESQGLSSEVVSAEDSIAFRTYLSDYGFELSEEEERIIEEYIGDEYSFIVSWIYDVDEFVDEVPSNYDPENDVSYYELGVFIEFPTEKMFYPLRLTSVYGDMKIPMRLQIVGHVEPDTSHDYESLHISYAHRSGNYQYPPAMYQLFNADPPPEGYTARVTIHDLEFTNMEISVSSSELNDDLWITSDDSAWLSLEKWIINHSLVTAIILLLLISMVVGIVAGWLAYAAYRPTLWKFALLGIANTLTIVGLWLIMRNIEVEKHFVRSSEVTPPASCRSDFIAVFTFAFMLVLGGSVMILWR